MLRWSVKFIVANLPFWYRVKSIRNWYIQWRFSHVIVAIIIHLDLISIPIHLWSLLLWNNCVESIDIAHESECQYVDIMTTINMVYIPMKIFSNAIFAHISTSGGHYLNMDRVEKLNKTAFLQPPLHSLSISRMNGAINPDIRLNSIKGSNNVCVRFN